jgi:hypothetical protein
MWDVNHTVGNITVSDGEGAKLKPDALHPARSTGVPNISEKPSKKVLLEGITQLNKPDVISA